jgi:hypothetical protein
VLTRNGRDRRRSKPQRAVRAYSNMMGLFCGRAQTGLRHAGLERRRFHFQNGGCTARTPAAPSGALQHEWAVHLAGTPVASLRCSAIVLADEPPRKDIERLRVADPQRNLRRLQVSLRPRNFVIGVTNCGKAAQTIALLIRSRAAMVTRRRVRCRGGTGFAPTIGEPKASNGTPRTNRRRIEITLSSRACRNPVSGASPRR